MPFPEAPRIRYRDNPLDQVICQLRFPPILKIDAEIPADFQGRIRHQFPSFIEKSTSRLIMPEAVDDQIPNELLQQMAASAGGKNYEFASDDGIWKVNLTRSFMALTAGKYERWEDFKAKLEIPANALVNVYAPDYFSRVGLRYIDIIRRSKLGLGDIPWRELLNQSLTGIIGSREVGDQVRALESVYEISLDENQGTVRIATRFVQSKDDGEICFMIDSDFFNKSKVPLLGAFDWLESFRISASRLIQWAVKEPLHEAMKPEVL